MVRNMSKINPEDQLLILSHLQTKEKLLGQRKLSPIRGKGTHSTQERNCY